MRHGRKGGEYEGRGGVMVLSLSCTGGRREDTTNEVADAMLRHETKQSTDDNTTF